MLVKYGLRPWEVDEMDPDVILELVAREVGLAEHRKIQLKRQEAEKRLNNNRLRLLRGGNGEVAG